MVPILGIVCVGSAGREVPLNEAVKRADLAAVRVLAQQGGINTSEVNGTTALHWAAELDNLEIVDVLIRAGADVKAANRYGTTPLALACTNGNAAIIERLLGAGADANAALPGGETALMTAARTGRVDALKVLLAHGADVNAHEATRGQTALMWAAAQNNIAAIRALIDAGADVHARSREPQFKASWWVGNGANQQIGDEVRIEFTPILFAARAGHIESVRALLEAGANVNDTAPNGTSALVLATLNSHWELAAFLLEKNADPNAAGQGWTALHQVARNRSPTLGEIPPPVQTGRLSSLDLVQKLIAHGANVNARVTKEMKDGYRNSLNRVGATPFLLAAKGIDVELMRALLSRGADPFLPTATNTTPLLVAAGVGLSAQGTDTGTNEDALDAVKFLLDLGADLQAANDRGETALHGAAHRGANALVQYLVDAGAKLDAKTKQGLTPLDYAAGKSESVPRIQAQTVTLIRKLMKDRSLSPDDDAGSQPPGDRKK
jgi:ankyrin repeat protein